MWSFLRLLEGPTESRSSLGLVEGRMGRVVDGSGGRRGFTE
jgi:hypothetical protein